jgi:hypothetical protein
MNLTAEERKQIASLHAQVVQQAAEIAVLRGLVADVIEDADEFETDWNKAARVALAVKKDQG